MSNPEFDEILAAISDPTVNEVGGGHVNKGIEFQRHWAVLRMFELSEEGQDDFLFLFEAIQDVAVLNSSSKPTQIQIFQVKKKDRNEWSWANLTGLHNPTNKRKTNPLESIKAYPLGKLYAAVRKFSSLGSTGCFLSNAGCDLPKETEGVMATSKREILDGLSNEFKTLLRQGLATYHAIGDSAPDLTKLFVERVDMPPGDPRSTLVGRVYEFLAKRSVDHAGQARSLVDALLVTVGRLSLNTESYKSFQDLCKACGLTKREFDDTLGTLEQVPDIKGGIDLYITALAQEGVPVTEIFRLKTSITSHFRRKVMGALTPEESVFAEECRTWVKENPASYPLRQYLSRSQRALSSKAQTLSPSDQHVLVLIATLEIQ